MVVGLLHPPPPPYTHTSPNIQKEMQKMTIQHYIRIFMLWYPLTHPSHQTYRNRCRRWKFHNTTSESLCFGHPFTSHPPTPRHPPTTSPNIQKQMQKVKIQHYIKTFMLCSPPMSWNKQKQIQKMKTPQHYIRIFMLGHPVAVERAVVDEELTVGHFHCPNSKWLPINVARHVGLWWEKKWKQFTFEK